MATNTSCSCMKNSFSDVLYKRGVPRNFSKFTNKHKKKSSGGLLPKDILKNFAKFTEKQLCRSLFFKKVAESDTESFPVKFSNFLRAIILKRICERASKLYLKRDPNAGVFL